MVCVNLYPFFEKVQSGLSFEETVEFIDIGGPTMIRAAAKNFNDVVIVPSKAEYGPLTDIIKAQGAETTKEQRKWFAERAFATSSHYDTAIDAYFRS